VMCVWYVCDECVTFVLEKQADNSEKADTTVSDSAEHDGDDNNEEKVDDTDVCVC
jgi:hypothetical protein